MCCQKRSSSLLESNQVLKFSKLSGSDFQMVPSLHKFTQVTFTQIHKLEACLMTKYIGLIIVPPFLMQTENDERSLLQKI